MDGSARVAKWNSDRVGEPLNQRTTRSLIAAGNNMTSKERSQSGNYQPYSTVGVDRLSISGVEGTRVRSAMFWSWHNRA